VTPALQISRTTVIVASERAISSDLAGEAAIIDFQSGSYYGLDEVGATIWKLIAEPRTVSEICDAVVAEYEVDPEVCERDVLALLGKLAASGLIETGDVSASR
jgi:Coenzyme PQQ synthesis protein D (PqqD)